MTPGEIGIPPAPWRLRGQSLQLLRRVPLAAARRLVPEPLRIVPVAPGRTLGVLYLARYAQGSTLEYDELIFAPALVTARGRIGFRVTGIWVNDARSMAGGRAIWSLPKQMADFHRYDAGHNEAGDCRVEDAAGLICEWRIERDRSAEAQSVSGAGIPLPLLLPVLAGPPERPHFFAGRGVARVSGCRGELRAPPGSVLGALGWVGRQHFMLAQPLRLTVPAP